MDKKIIKRIIQVFFVWILQTVLFFSFAGRLDVWRAWMLFYIQFLNLLFNLVIFYKISPEIIKERSEFKQGTKSWDWIFAIVYTISLFGIYILAGLDARFNWFHLGAEYFVIGMILYVIGSVLTSWALISNKFFESTVVIMKEHEVVESGPYSIVRHPGYAGMILFYTAGVFVIGSAVALIPALILAIAFIWRTSMEDKTLQKELKGYKEYCKKVKYKLVPYIW